MTEEISSLKRLGTYHLVRLPEGRKAIGCKWVYKIKRDANGKILRYKARLVAQGFAQRKGTDFQETFAPVARMTSQRIVIAIATTENLELYTVDVDNAYLNGVIDTKLYMRQPVGFEEPGHKGLVCELDKGLYGLKQAGNIWNAAIHAYILELGFSRTSADLCVYTVDKFGTRMAIGLHVDDFLVAATPQQFEWFTTALKVRFSIKSQQATMCLGLKIEKTPVGYSFGQQHYLETLLVTFGMQDCKVQTTPMTKGEVTSLAEGSFTGKPLNTADHHLYRQIVGKLMYAMVGSRPDLAHCLSLLGRYGAAPLDYHLGLAKRVLQYVRGTINYRLHYTRGSSAPNKTPELKGYVDSDWANSDDRKSTTGYCFFLGDNLISWCSKRQSIVATSTTVAEYVALYEATTETICLRRLLEDMKVPQRHATTIFEDNQTAIKLAADETSHKRTKHVDVKYQYTREQQTAGAINIVYVQNKENLADFFTKSFVRDQHHLGCKLLELYT